MFNNITETHRDAPGMCARTAIDVTNIMQAMMHSPERSVCEVSCPGCVNTDTIMIYQIQNLPPEKPIEKLPEYDVVPIEPIL
jgi:hypothetical protein